MLALFGEGFAALTTAINVDKTRSADVQLLLGPAGHNETAVRTHTSLNWSDPSVFGTDVHLSFASKSQVMDIEWDSSVQVDFADQQYDAVVRDVSAEGEERIQLRAVGDFFQDNDTM